jgi:hypothetical protein
LGRLYGGNCGSYLSAAAGTAKMCALKASSPTAFRAWHCQPQNTYRISNGIAVTIHCFHEFRG